MAPTVEGESEESGQEADRRGWAVSFSLKGTAEATGAGGGES